MQIWSITLHGPFGVVSCIDTPESQFVIGTEVGDDVFTVVGEGVCARHAWVWISEAGMQVENLGGGTLVNGHSIAERVQVEYPAEVQVGELTLVVAFKALEEAQEQESSLAATIPQHPTREAQRPIEESQAAVTAQNKAPLAGEYTLVREIARGGMGQIYFGEDPQLDRQVAVKVSSISEGGQDPRFSKEAKVLANLAHPNIVPIYNIGVDSVGRPFYAMKLVKGRTLQAVLNAIGEGDPVALKEYPRAALLTVFRKVCDAMAFAHSKGFLHRDLKPENIMVGEYGEVLVMDWGLAKVLGGREDVAREKSPAKDMGDYGMTMEGEVMGTPQYMSPEQAEGMVAELDARSDIYSLGGILYAILTLRPPIGGKTLNEVLTRVKKGEITAMVTKRGPKGDMTAGTPTAMGMEVPEALQAVTLKAMSTDRNNRYPTVEALTADIEAYQNGFATSALHVTALGQFLLLMKRNRGVTVSIATALLTLTVLTVWFVFSLQIKERAATHAAEVAEEEKNKALEAEKLARLSSSKAQMALAETSFRSGDFPAMTEALKLCPPDLRDQTWEYLAAKKDSSIGTLKLPGFEKLVAIRVVPGAAGQFALATAQGEVGFVQADSGQLLRTVKTPPGLSDLVFSGDGLTFVAVFSPTELFFHDTATGELRTKVKLPAKIKDYRGDFVPAAESIALNQNGSLLGAVVEGKGGPHSVILLLVSVADGVVQWQTDLGEVRGIQFDREGNKLTAISGGGARWYRGFDTTNGKKLFETQFNCLCQAIHPDGKTLAIGGYSGEVRIIDLASGRTIQKAKLHSGRIMSMAWTDDGHLLTQGTEGKIYDSRWLFKIWAPDNLAFRAAFSGLRPGTPVRWAYDPLSGYLLTGDFPSCIWRIPAGRELARMSHRSESGYSGAFLSDSLLLAREAWGLTLYDVSTPREWVKAKEAPTRRERYSAVHQKTGVVALSGVDKPIALHLLSSTGSTMVEFFSKPLANQVSDLRFHPRGDSIALTLIDGSLLTFSVPSGEPLLEIPGKFQKAAFLEPDNRLVASRTSVTASGIVDYHLQQIDGATGANLKTTPIRYEIQALAVSPDQSVLAVGGTDTSIHFFDPQTLEEKPSLRAHEGDISALTFHPTAPILASASSDGSVKLWNYQTGRLLDHFIGLAGMPVTLSFSPNGRLLFAEAEERTMRLYDVSHLATTE